MNQQFTSFLDKKLRRRSRSVQFFHNSSNSTEHKSFTLSKSNDILTLKNQLLQREKEAALASEIGQALLKQNKDLLNKLDNLQTDQDLTQLHKKLSLTTSSPSLSRKPSQEELNHQTLQRGEQVNQFCSFVNNQVISKIQTFIKDYQQIRESLPPVSQVDVSFADMNQPFNHHNNRPTSITDALDLIHPCKPIDPIKQIEVSTDLSSLLMIQAKMLSRTVVDTQSQKDLVEMELTRKETEFQKMFDDYTKLYDDHTSVLDKVWDLELHIQQLTSQVDSLTKTNTQLVQDNDILLKRIQSATDTIDRLKDRENNLSDSLTYEMRKHVKDTQNLRQTILKLQEDLAQFERENNLPVNLGNKTSLTSIVHHQPEIFLEQDHESIRSSYHSTIELQLDNDITLPHLSPSSPSPIESESLISSTSSSPNSRKLNTLKLQLSPQKPGSYQLNKMPSKAFSVTDSGYSGSVQNSFLESKSPTSPLFQHLSRLSIDPTTHHDYSSDPSCDQELDGPSNDPMCSISLDIDHGYHINNPNFHSTHGIETSFFCMNSNPTSTLTFKETLAHHISPSKDRPLSELISMSHDIQSTETRSPNNPSSPYEKYQSDIESTLDQLTTHSKPKSTQRHPKKYNKPRALSYCPSNEFSNISDDESSVHNAILASEILEHKSSQTPSKTSFKPMLSEEDLSSSISGYNSRLSLRRSSKNISNSDTLKLRMMSGCSLPPVSNLEEIHNEEDEDETFQHQSLHKNNDLFKMNTFKLITKTVNKKRNSVNPESTFSTTGKVIEQLTSDPKLQPIATRIFELGDKIIYQEIVKAHQTVLYEEDNEEDNEQVNEQELSNIEECSTCVNCRRLSHQQTPSIKEPSSNNHSSTNLYHNSNNSSTRTKLDLKLIPTNLTSSFQPVAEVDTEFEEDTPSDFDALKPPQLLLNSPMTSLDSPTVPTIPSSPNHNRTLASSNPLANLGMPMGIQSTPTLVLTQRPVPVHATCTNPLTNQSNIIPNSMMERNLSDDDSRLMIFASISEAIQEVMQGEFMWKSTSKSLLNPTEKRHLRFFWVNPQSRILYWSVKNPGTERSLYIKESGGSSNGRHSIAKSAFITGVSLVADVIDDLKSEFNHTREVPPPLSIVIRTNRRSIKIKAQSETRHGIWMMALNYLQTSVPTHLGGANGASEVTGVHRPDFALGLTPPQNTNFMNGGFGGLRRNSQMISW